MSVAHKTRSIIDVSWPDGRKASFTITDRGVQVHQTAPADKKLDKLVTFDDLFELANGQTVVGLT